MGGIDLILELALVVLLGATLVHAIRLQRALGGLRRGQAALQEATAGFDSGVHQAESGLMRLRDAADLVAAQLSQAVALRDDLAFLADRGEGLADRLDVLIREGRTVAPPAYSPSAHAGEAVDEAPLAPPVPAFVQASPLANVPRARSLAERNLMVALGGRG